MPNRGIVEGNIGKSRAGAAPLFVELLLDVYAHASEQMLQDTADRMQGYYDGLGVNKPQKP